MKTQKIKTNNQKRTEKSKLDFNVLRNAEKYSVDFFDIDNKISSSTVKQIREEHNMSQAFFARVLGVSKKTIEKWEQGKNPITGTSARLLYLIKEDFVTIRRFYQEIVEVNGMKHYSSTNRTMNKELILVKKPTTERTKTFSICDVKDLEESPCLIA